MLAQEGVQRGQPRANLTVGLPADHAEEERKGGHQGKQDKAVQGHPGVQADHDDGQADHLDRVPEQLDKHIGKDLVDRLHVVGDAGDDLAHGRDVKEAHRQALHMREQVVAHAVDDVLAHLLHHQVWARLQSNRPISASRYRPPAAARPAKRASAISPASHCSAGG